MSMSMNMYIYTYMVHVSDSACEYHMNGIFFIFIYFILYTLCLSERTGVAGAAVRQRWKQQQQQKQTNQNEPNQTKPKYSAQSINFRIERSYPTSNALFNDIFRSHTFSMLNIIEHNLTH